MNLLSNVKNELSCVVLYVYIYIGLLHNLLVEKNLRIISFGFNWNYLVGVFCLYIKKSLDHLLYIYSDHKCLYNINWKFDGYYKEACIPSWLNPVL